MFNALKTFVGKSTDHSDSDSEKSHKKEPKKKAENKSNSPNEMSPVTSPKTPKLSTPTSDCESYAEACSPAGLISDLDVNSHLPTGKTQEASHFTAGKTEQFSESVTQTPTKVGKITVVEEITKTFQPLSINEPEFSVTIDPNKQEKQIEAEETNIDQTVSQSEQSNVDKSPILTKEHHVDMKKPVRSPRFEDHVYEDVEEAVSKAFDIKKATTEFIHTERHFAGWTDDTCLTKKLSTDLAGSFERLPSKGKEKKLFGFFSKQLSKDKEEIEEDNIKHEVVEKHDREVLKEKKDDSWQKKQNKTKRQPGKEDKIVELPEEVLRSMEDSRSFLLKEKEEYVPSPESQKRAVVKTLQKHEVSSESEPKKTGFLGLFSKKPKKLEVKPEAPRTFEETESNEIQQAIDASKVFLENEWENYEDVKRQREIRKLEAKPADSIQTLIDAKEQKAELSKEALKAMEDTRSFLKEEVQRYELFTPGLKEPAASEYKQASPKREEKKLRFPDPYSKTPRQSEATLEPVLTIQEPYSKEVQDVTDDTRILSTTEIGRDEDIKLALGSLQKIESHTLETQPIVTSEPLNDLIQHKVETNPIETSNPLNDLQHKVELSDEVLKSIDDSRTFLIEEIKKSVFLDEEAKIDVRLPLPVTNEENLISNKTKISEDVAIKSEDQQEQQVLDVRDVNLKAKRERKKSGSPFKIFSKKYRRDDREGIPQKEVILSDYTITNMKNCDDFLTNEVKSYHDYHPQVQPSDKQTEESIELESKSTALFGIFSKRDIKCSPGTVRKKFKETKNQQFPENKGKSEDGAENVSKPADETIEASKRWLQTTETEIKEMQKPVSEKAGEILEPLVFEDAQIETTKKEKFVEPTKGTKKSRGFLSRIGKKISGKTDDSKKIKEEDKQVDKDLAYTEAVIKEKETTFKNYLGDISKTTEGFVAEESQQVLPQPSCTLKETKTDHDGVKQRIKEETEKHNDSTGTIITQHKTNVQNRTNQCIDGVVMQGDEKYAIGEIKTQQYTTPIKDFLSEVNENDCMTVSKDVHEEITVGTTCVKDPRESEAPQNESVKHLPIEQLEIETSKEVGQRREEIIEKTKGISETPKNATEKLCKQSEGFFTKLGKKISNKANDTKPTAEMPSLTDTQTKPAVFCDPKESVKTELENMQEREKEVCEKIKSENDEFKIVANEGKDAFNTEMEGTEGTAKNAGNFVINLGRKLFGKGKDTKEIEENTQLAVQDTKECVVDCYEQQISKINAPEEVLISEGEAAHIVEQGIENMETDLNESVPHMHGYLQTRDDKEEDEISQPVKKLLQVQEQVDAENALSHPESFSIEIEDDAQKKTSKVVREIEKAGNSLNEGNDVTTASLRQEGSAPSHAVKGESNVEEKIEEITTIFNEQIQPIQDIKVITQNFLYNIKGLETSDNYSGIQGNFILTNSTNDTEDESIRESKNPGRFLKQTNETITGNTSQDSATEISVSTKVKEVTLENQGNRVIKSDSNNETWTTGDNKERLRQATDLHDLEGTCEQSKEISFLKPIKIKSQTEEPLKLSSDRDNQPKELVIETGSKPTRVVQLKRDEYSEVEKAVNATVDAFSQDVTDTSVETERTIKTGVASLAKQSSEELQESLREKEEEIAEALKKLEEGFTFGQTVDFEPKRDPASAKEFLPLLGNKSEAAVVCVKEENKELPLAAEGTITSNMAENKALNQDENILTFTEELAESASNESNIFAKLGENLKGKPTDCDNPERETKTKIGSHLSMAVENESERNFATFAADGVKAATEKQQTKVATPVEVLQEKLFAFATEFKQGSEYLAAKYDQCSEFAPGIYSDLHQAASSPRDAAIITADFISNEKLYVMNEPGKDEPQISQDSLSTGELPVSGNAEDFINLDSVSSTSESNVDLSRLPTERMKMPPEEHVYATQTDTEFYITSPTAKMHVQPQRFPRAERPELGETTNLALESSGDEDDYVVIDPPDNSFHKSKPVHRIASEDDSVLIGQAETRKGHYEIFTPMITALTDVGSDTKANVDDRKEKLGDLGKTVVNSEAAVSSDKKLTPAEQKFESMASQALEKEKEGKLAAAELEHRQDSEFSRIVSQLSTEEVSDSQKEYSALWEAQIFSPSDDWNSKTPGSQADVQELLKGRL